MKLYKKIQYWNEFFSLELLNVLNSKVEDNYFYLDELINFLFILVPKINFLNKNKLMKIFMSEYSKNNIEYKRIESLYEFICWLICFYKKNCKKTYFIRFEIYSDLQGFNRTGEKIDWKRIIR